MHKYCQYFFTCLFFGLSVGVVQAQPSAEDDFVQANILGIFYHELGHVVIHTEDVPIFAQEEDAADVFSIFLIHTLFEEDTAQSLAREAALGFAAEVQTRDAHSETIAWWDTHGPDEQRFYNTVCIFYGANPEQRARFAQEMALPEERAHICPAEFEQAEHSWGAVLEAMGNAPYPMTFAAQKQTLAARLLQDEVGYLNSQIRLSRPVQVSVQGCGEASAYYDPDASRIVFCTEFEDYLRTQAPI